MLDPKTPVTIHFNLAHVVAVVTAGEEAVVYLRERRTVRLSRAEHGNVIDSLTGGDWPTAIVPYGDFYFD